MNRILLADDSPHAQRMGERILREEGYEIVSVTDGNTALVRMDDVDPDLLLADVFLPGQSGLELCRRLKKDPKHRHMRIVLTAGLLETFDEEEAVQAGADAIIRKPFEASVVLETIKPLITAAQDERIAGPREVARDAPPGDLRDAQEAAPREKVVPISKAGPEHRPATAGTGVSEEELLRAAVTVALDAAFPALVEEITSNVLRSLRVVGNAAPAQNHEPPSEVPLPISPLMTDDA